MYKIICLLVGIVYAQLGKCYKASRQTLFIGSNKDFSGQRTGQKETSPKLGPELEIDSSLASALCTNELNLKRRQYRGVYSLLNWNEHFAKRAAQTAEQWKTKGHSDTGLGYGGFITGQIMATQDSCYDAANAWVEGEFSSRGVCKDFKHGGGHCQIILNEKNIQVGCAYKSGNIVCNFGA